MHAHILIPPHPARVEWTLLLRPATARRQRKKKQKAHPELRLVPVLAKRLHGQRVHQRGLLLAPGRLALLGRGLELLELPRGGVPVRVELLEGVEGVRRQGSATLSLVMRIQFIGPSASHPPSVIVAGGAFLRVSFPRTHMGSSSLSAIWAASIQLTRCRQSRPCDAMPIRVQNSGARLERIWRVLEILAGFWGFGSVGVAFNWYRTACQQRSWLAALPKPKQERQRRCIVLPLKLSRHRLFGSSHGTVIQKRKKI